ncbi:hypothetical protein QTN25_005685 [Entamoeba marina]
MQSNQANFISKLDNYSLLIVSKYLKRKIDFMNVICVCKKFKDTTEKLHYNPIPIRSLKLFPKIQTQYLYRRKDKFLKNVQRYEIRYKVNYEEYLKFKKDDIKCKNVFYSKEDTYEYGDSIPNNVTSLNERCFLKSGINTITIPNNITSIGNNCFIKCLNLESISLPSYLDTIGYGCFCACYKLSSITLPSSLTSLEKEAFYACFMLTSIELPPKLQSIGDKCFSHCSSLQSLGKEFELKPNMCIGMECFLNCTSLKHLMIQPNEKEITFEVSYCDSLFYKQFGITCRNITFTLNDLNNQIDGLNQLNDSKEFDIPNGVIQLSDDIFYFSSYLTINLPSTLQSMGSYCFMNCHSLTSINLPSTLKKISNNCFDSCESLESINLPDSLTSLGNNCFGGCLSLTTIKFSSNLTELKDGCFGYCSSLTSVTIPSTLKSIGDYCFRNCSSLSSINLPTTIQSFGKNCFIECSLLK